MSSPETAARALDSITLNDVRAAADRLRDVALLTPLLPIGEGVYLKPESLQPTGSFKIRGAYNALAQLTAEERRGGVIAHSSGNHAQAVARAGRLLGIRVMVVMPNTAPRIKVAGVQADGPEIVFVGPHNEERVARAHEIADREGMVLVPSANHAHVIAGQGTIGTEIVDQLAELRTRSAAPVILAPIGLGGLAAGIALAVKALAPASTVLGVEPALAADTRESLERGERIAWRGEDTGRTIADGLRGESPAEIAFAVLQRHLDGVLTVDDHEIVQAMRYAAREARVVLEPSGATALAAMLAHRAELPLGPIVVVASGGNVDPDKFAGWIADRT